MKRFGRGKKRLQHNTLICPLEFQPETDEAFAVDGREHTHMHTNTHTHTHTQLETSHSRAFNYKNRT